MIAFGGKIDGVLDRQGRAFEEELARQQGPVQRSLREDDVGLAPMMPAVRQPLLPVASSKETSTSLAETGEANSSSRMRSNPTASE